MVAVAKQEKQGQQGKAENDQPMGDFTAEAGSRIRAGMRVKMRPNSS